VRSAMLIIGMHDEKTIVESTNVRNGSLIVQVPVSYVRS
jgi:hypothetical protein